MKKLARHFSGTCYPLSRRGSSIIDSAHRGRVRRETAGEDEASEWAEGIGRANKRKVDEEGGGENACVCHAMCFLH